MSAITAGSPTEARLHARLAPSGAHQWAPDDGCRGAVGMQVRYPQDTDSEKAREGVAAHHHVTETLMERAVAVGTEAPNNVPINQEMVDAGLSMILHVNRIRTQYPNALFRVETRVAMTLVHPTECWGTPDAFLIDKEARVLWVWDYKYGHRYVDAFRNWQLILYAIGVLENHAFHREDWHGWRINFVICQPRNYHPAGPIREWYIGGAGLMEYVPRLRKAAYETLDPGARLVTGDHCRDCTARHACPALMQSAALGVDVAYDQTPMELSPHAMGLELRYLRDAEARIKARADALEEQILGQMRSGRDVPLWKADYSKGREVWDVPVSQVITLGRMCGVDVAKPAEVITPVQARAAGIDERMLLGLTRQPRESMRLVAVTDDSVSRAFGGE